MYRNYEEGENCPMAACDGFLLQGDAADSDLECVECGWSTEDEEDI